MTLSYNIVTVNVNVVQAPTASTLQQSGAIVSLGGSTLTAGTYQFCGNLAAVEAIVSTAGNFADVTGYATKFFAQGNAIGVYVLELGTQSTTQLAITALQTWITDNPGIFYAYLVPVEFDAGSTDWTTFLANYEAPGDMVYFFTPTTLTTYSQYTSAMKDVFWYVPYTTGGSVYEVACPFQSMLANAPSAASQPPQMNYRPLYGIAAPWPLAGNTTNINAILTAGGNLATSAAQGGISGNILRGGTYADGNQVNFWYAIDWVNINVNLELSNTIINGSATTQNPLYYNQNGINRLRASAQGVINSATSFGLLLNAATVQATPFATYTTQNPTDYKASTYNGLSVTVVPQLGFDTITFNFTATNIPNG